MSWFPLLLAVHVALAIALLLPSVALPFVLRRVDGRAGSGTRALMAMQGTGTVVIAVALAVTGAALLMLLGPELVTRPWLILALILYAINLGVATFVSRPGLRRLIGLGGSPADDETWRRRARRQRYVAYAMAGVIGVIGLLMSTKPDLW